MIFPLMASALALAELVPPLAHLLGGDRAHAVAKRAVSAAKHITGTDNDLEALKRLQNDTLLLADFQRSILQLEADLERDHLHDRQDARARDVALRQSGDCNTRANIMVVSAALGLVLCLGVLSCYSNHLPGEAVGIISTIAGIFGACLKDAYAFEFGSSRGSKEKDAALADIIQMK